MIDEILRRSFDAELSEGDGRTVFGRCVPYGQVAEVADVTPEGVRTYREAFDFGAFRHVARAAHRVELTHEHDAGIFATIGKATDLIERDDGLYGTFRVFESAAGDQALVLLREKILTGLSVVARTLGPGKRRGGVVIRTSCHLESVGLCRQPAYSGAEVLAVRTHLEVERPRRNEQLDERIARLRGEAS